MNQTKDHEITLANTKSPIKAIRDKCLDCSGGSYGEVRHCPIKSCPLWLYRLGVRPATALAKGDIKAEDLDVDRSPMVAC